MLVVGAALLFAAAYLIPGAGFFNNVLSASGAVALFAAILQALRDEDAHQRNLELRQREQNFSLGIVSHMAQVVFDMEVEFSQLYVDSVITVLDQLRHEQAEEVLDQAQKLTQLRTKYSLWVPKELSEKLSVFESELRMIGSDAIMEQQAHEELNRIVFAKDKYRRILNVLGEKPIDGEIEPDRGAAKAIENLSALLGAADYIALRDCAIGAAKRSTGRS